MSINPLKMRSPMIDLLTATFWPVRRRRKRRIDVLTRARIGLYRIRLCKCSLASLKQRQKSQFVFKDITYSITILQSKKDIEVFRYIIIVIANIHNALN